MWLRAARQALHARCTFGTPLLYRYVRHPLYVGWFFIFWATPTMTVTHLVFAVATSAYILIAIQLEERDLIDAHPEYAEYRRRVPMLVPFTKSRRQAERGAVRRPAESSGGARMLTQRVDLFDSTYGHFTQDVLAAIRRETFGQDIGQNSWLTVEEYDRFIAWLRLEPEQHVLEVASGSGGPALYLADRASCHVTGIDSNRARRRRGDARGVRLARVAPDQLPGRGRERAAAVRQRHVRCACCASIR